ncbi:GATA transcription factor 16-like [Diospyros lotus]|uniref:GATA transcription factor 16-like n=1 Tax=Diospyros lotus TaxID=55363 RepID=UPI0022522817|nr:GATA transcription factor 16-like [Diospyros lotus]
MSEQAMSMVDPSDKGSESEDLNSKTSESEGSHVKTCADCGTTKTPLWRGGPAGPKSLCNACGIRSRKKRRALLGLSKGSSTVEKKSKRTGHQSSSSSSNSRSSGGDNSSFGESVKRKLMGEEALQRSNIEKMRRKLGEEEQAAMLLMALSCGSVYA